MSTLIVAPAWIGDAVLSQPLIGHLAATDELIDVLAPSWVAPVYERMANVRQVINNPFGHGALQLGKRRQLGLQLRARRYQRAVVLPNSFKSALPVWFARIPETVGYRGEARGWLLSDCRTLAEAAHPTMAERFLALGFPAQHATAIPVTNPVLKVDAAQQANALQAFGLNTQRPVLALCPGAEYGPAKRWPAAHFAKLARQRVDAGDAVWVFGGPGDVGVAEEINRLADGHCTVLAGKTSLRQAIDLLALAHNVVTNDSGLMHIACAVGVRVTALYGSSSPNFTPPLSSRARIISLNLDCSPCFKRECPLGHFNCMNQLSPSSVLAAVESSPRASPAPPLLQ